jgi:predicted HTH domain antitoxin
MCKLIASDDRVYRGDSLADLSRALADRALDETDDLLRDREYCLDDLKNESGD